MNKILIGIWIAIISITLYGCEDKKPPVTVTQEINVRNPNAFAPSSDGNLLLADLSTGISHVSLKSFSHLNLQHVDLRLPAAVSEVMGKYYIADYRNNRIVVVNESGLIEHEWSHESMSDPEGISADANGNIYVASYGNGRILKFDKNGSYIGEWAEVTSPDDVLVHPHGIFSYEGSLFVTELNHPARIIEYDLNGKFLNQFGIGDESWSLEYPTSLFVKNKLVYVADAVDSQIKIFDTSGKFVKSFGKRGIGVNEFYYPYGVGVDRENNIYVGDTHNKRIQVFDSDFNLIKIYGPESLITEQITENVSPLKIPDFEVINDYGDDLCMDHQKLYGVDTKRKEFYEIGKDKPILHDFTYPYAAVTCDNLYYIADEPGSLNAYDQAGMNKLVYSLTSAQFDPTEPLSAMVYRFEDIIVTQDELIIANTLPGNLLFFDKYGSLKSCIDIGDDDDPITPRPTGLSALQNNVFYADMSGTVGVLDRANMTHKSFSSPIGIYEPYKIAISKKNGLIAVTEPNKNRIQLWDTENYTWKGWIDLNKLSFDTPTGLTFSDEGILYIACKGNQKIIALNTGKLEFNSPESTYAAFERSFDITKKDDPQNTDSLFMSLYDYETSKALQNFEVYKTEEGIVKYDFSFSWLNFNLPVTVGYGNQLWPNAVAHYALLNHFSSDESAAANEKLHADWLVNHIIDGNSGVAYWPNSYENTLTELEDGFAAASTQALGAAALIKAAEHFPENAELYINTAQKALKSFERPTTEIGGVQTTLLGDVYYADYFNSNGFIRYDMIPFIWTTAALYETGQYGQEFYDQTLNIWMHADRFKVDLIDSKTYFGTVFNLNGDGNQVIHMETSKWVARLINYLSN